MFLRSLTLKGFKSFADATTLDLEPGVTVVVGPNGSGKSNVVDAIAWVLGAQAPSSVRSNKMDDVIFAGTADRPALGRAEVTLTIDNSSGQLAVDFEEVTIRRTLFRSGDSEYALNGVSCRLLDIQELLSDSGVGRQQHTIISQGQIDAVLNARPEERRHVIEEAAGVLKYRRRKERSERRLGATEANLTRLQDLVREVRRQLKPLERQADAARRHGDLLDELVALRTHIAGREIATLKERLRAGAVRRRDLLDTDARLREQLRGVDAAVLAAEARLTSFGGDDVGDSLATYEGLRARAHGVARVVDERRRSLAAELARDGDREMVDSLVAERERLATELDDVAARVGGLETDATQLEAAEVDLADRARAFEERWSDAVTAGADDAGRVRGEFGAVEKAISRADTERSQVRRRIDELDARRTGLDAEAASMRDSLAISVTALSAAEAALVDAEATLTQAVDAATVAEAAASEAEADRRHWTSRADALALALDEARARSGAEALAGLDGALGTLAELVEVDAGWESAFEAAAGEAVAAVVVADPATGREALARLGELDTAGAVVAMGIGGPQTPPVGHGEPVRPHVRGVSPLVDVLLDSLIGGAVAVATPEAAVDVVLDSPTAVVVTRGGDRFSPTGWRVGVDRAGATGTALEEAIRRAETAVQTLDDAKAALAGARQARADAERGVADARRGCKVAEVERDRLRTDLERKDATGREIAVEIEALGARVEALDARLDADRRRAAELAGELPALEQAEAARAESGRRMAAERSDLDERREAVGALRRDLEVRAASLEQRRELLTKRIAEVDTRLEGRREAEEQGQRRRDGVTARLTTIESLGELLGGAVADLDGRVTTLRERRRRQSDEVRAIAAELDELRKSQAAMAGEMKLARDEAASIEVAEAELNVRLETIVETVRSELDCEPATAVATECPELPEGVAPSARVRELDRELKLMGPINPLALSEFDTLSERHEFLTGQLDDVRSSRRELQKVIRAVDDEIVRLFAAAYADVAENFETLFAALFPGGKGRIRLTDPSDMLATGVEIEAQPSGKNVRKLSLLSGGERSLTALAFLFAVFRSRPSPFYVMDEVEAALDDVNLHRFLGLVAEFRDDAQLLIVSHQKRTMEAADCLYGVSMQPGGASRVVSEKADTAA
ncbi:MAG: chromosome segregation protein SMC [Acidimicrobiales bacterium]